LRAVEQRAYVTIARWPDSMNAESRTRVLCEIAGLDPYVAQQRVTQGAPLIVMRAEPEVARGIIEQLRARGVVACAPTRDQLAKLAPPMRAKAMAAAPGAPEPMYMVESWKEESRGLRARDIALLVRGRLDNSTVRTGLDAGPRGTGLVAAAALGGAGVALHMASNPGPTRSTTFKFTEMLDIYLRDGSRIRIDGDKFSFDVLGPEKGYTDAENMDKLTLRLGGEAPRAIVDTGFAKFRCPLEMIKDFSHAVSHSTVRRQDQKPAFDFYSAWTVYVCKALVSGVKEPGGGSQTPQKKH